MYIASNGIKTAVILRDTDAFSPRDPDYQDNITKMVCWHSRYRLGDKHDFKDPSAFAEDLVDRYVKQKDVIAALVNGELKGFRLGEKNSDGSFCVEANISLIPGKEKWERMDWAVTKDTLEVIEGEAIFDIDMDVLDYCYPDELLRLCNKYGDVAIMPLFLYDHSGISMSTDSFVGRAHHADWDSGQVGYIYMDKKTAMENLRIAGDKIRLAQRVSYEDAFQIPMKPDEKVDDVMVRNGYTPVRAEDIVNIDALIGPNTNQPIIMPKWAHDGRLYKKDHTLFLFNHFNPNDTFEIEPVATFNPHQYLALTEDTWKARAEEVMRGDVTEYDNYLTGEVYGYQLYEGLKEVESCWGFNPGTEDIKKLMNSELAGWFGGKLDFEYESEDDFDIEDFFEENEFPGIRDKVAKDVKEFIQFESDTSKIYPFAMSAEELLGNKNDVLDKIVDEIYSEHVEYDTDRIFDAILDNAGAARAVQPKLSVADLDPSRDYTAEEIMEVFRNKPSLNDLIANAKGRSGSADAGQPAKNVSDKAR